MALSNLNKETTTKLFEMLSLNSNNDIEKIKNNYSAYGQLIILAEQINQLQDRANIIIKNITINEHLHNIEMNCKKVVGNYYYHYLINNKEILSLISPEEWNRQEDDNFKFLGKYLYNFDNIFYLQ
jgi:hypothetical protein